MLPRLIFWHLNIRNVCRTKEQITESLDLSVRLLELFDRCKDPLIVAPDVLESFLEFLKALLFFQLGQYLLRNPENVYSGSALKNFSTCRFNRDSHS